MSINDVRVHKFCNDVSGYDGFVLYGAGYIANKLLDALDKIKLKPSYCVVTRMEDNLKESETMSIYSFSDKVSELHDKNILIVVAVSELYEKEIVQMLQDNGIENIVLASDYFWYPLEERTFYDIYKDKDFSWYISRIEELYYDQYGVELDFPAVCQTEKKKKERILFVVNSFSPRVVKIARALQECGKEVIVFLDAKMKHSLWAKFYSALQKEKIKNVYYSSIEELILGLIQNNGDVIHVFSNGWNPYTAYILVKLQVYLGRVVFENYDILNGFYIDIDEDKLKLERYCLENAIGVCYREYSLEYLTEVLEFKFQGKSVRFFDYCSDEKIKEKRIDKNELSLCYAGGVVTEDEFGDCPFGGFMQLAEMCEDNKCHLHIYPSAWDEKRYEKYIEKDRKSEYFHFHETVAYERLIKELLQYDYGIVPTRDDIWEKEYSGYNTKYKYIYAATNKFFDYLDAGLPVIAAMPLKISKYLEEKGVLINWTNGQYDFNYLARMKESMQKKVVNVKEHLKMQNHIGELVEFYESL